MFLDLLPSGLTVTNPVSLTRSGNALQSPEDSHQAPEAFLSPDEFSQVRWSFLLRPLAACVLCCRWALGGGCVSCRVS